MNVQVTELEGRLLWASPALPGAVHEIRAAREHGIIDALAQAGVLCWADKGYRGAPHGPGRHRRRLQRARPLRVPGGEGGRRTGPDAPDRGPHPGPRAQTFEGMWDNLVFRPQPTVTVLWALGDETTRRAIEAAHERAIAATLGWIEDQVAVIRYGAGGSRRVRPARGVVAARFRHYQARSGMPLLHDHVLLPVKAQRPGEDGNWVWGSVHTEVLYENTVAASALYNELVMAEVCQALGLAAEPRTVTR